MRLRPTSSDRRVIAHASVSVLKRMFQTGRGLSVPDTASLALNLSFVLHEASGSDPVRSAVQAVRTHARSLPNYGPELARPATLTGIEADTVSLWITATLGLPHWLPIALGSSPDRVVAVDVGDVTSEHVLFRGSANLALPDDSPRVVGTVALILKPGRRSSHLAIGGTHRWPEESDEALRSLERLIQAYAAQWMPPQRLWSAPAEILLPDEVY